MCAGFGRQCDGATFCALENVTFAGEQLAVCNIFPVVACAVGCAVGCVVVTEDERCFCTVCDLPDVNIVEWGQEIPSICFYSKIGVDAVGCDIAIVQQCTGI